VRPAHFDGGEPGIAKNPDAFLQSVVFQRNGTSSHVKASDAANELKPTDESRKPNPLTTEQDT
jgi:hypothetical protein